MPACNTIGPQMLVGNRYGTSCPSDIIRYARGRCDHGASGVIMLLPTIPACTSINPCLSRSDVTCDKPHNGAVSHNPQTPTTIGPPITRAMLATIQPKLTSMIDMPIIIPIATPSRPSRAPVAIITLTIGIPHALHRRSRPPYALINITAPSPSNTSPAESSRNPHPSPAVTQPATIAITASARLSLRLDVIACDDVSIAFVI